MHNNQSSYSRWSWIIALILAIILVWMYLTGKGPNGTCCNHTEEQLAPTASEAMPIEAPSVITEAFSFSASEDEFIGSGEANNINWISDVDALKAFLTGGFTADGDESTIVLSGNVDSTQAKQQKGENAQVFFGPDVVIDNQITVTEPVETPPDVAKLYFDIGFHRLPAEGLSTLEPTIAWLNAHQDAKAIISGFHDPTGDFASNQKLAKNRASSVVDALVAAGVANDRIEMRKPESTTGDGDLSEARRVEVSIE